MQATLGVTIPVQLWFCLQGSLAIFIAGQLLTKRNQEVRPRADEEYNQANSSLSDYLNNSGLARNLVIFSLFSHLALVFFMIGTNQTIEALIGDLKVKDPTLSISDKNTWASVLCELSHFLLPAILLAFAGFELFKTGAVQRLLFFFIIAVAVVIVVYNSDAQYKHSDSLQSQDTAYIQTSSKPPSDYATYSPPTKEQGSTYSDSSRASSTEANPQTPKPEATQKPESRKPESSYKDKTSRQEHTKDGTNQQQYAPDKQTSTVETVGKGMKEVPKVKPTQEKSDDDEFSWVSVLFEIIKFLLEVLL